MYISFKNRDEQTVTICTNNVHKDYHYGPELWVLSEEQLIQMYHEDTLEKCVYRTIEVYPGWGYIGV
jgi:hypothetical protein